MCGPVSAVLTPLCPLADGTSTLCLSSVRELPSQLQDLYQQGFILAAVHPFVHPCGPKPASVQRQLYRAVLIKVSDRWGHNTANRNMTAACNSTGGADIYYIQGSCPTFYLRFLPQILPLSDLSNATLLHHKTS